MKLSHLLQVSLSILLSSAALAIQGVPLSIHNLQQAAHDSLALLGTSDAFGFQTPDGRVFAYRPSTQALTDLGLGFPIRSLNGGSLLFDRREQLFGADLNGDGDLLDAVLQQFQLGTGVASNLALAMDTWNPSSFTSAGSRVAFRVPESAQGVDLDGDGAELDFVLHWLDGYSGSVHNVGLVPGHFVFAGKAILFTVFEFNLGGDQNGDGDSFDQILCRQDTTSGAFTNYGLALMPSDGGPFSTPGEAVVTMVSQATGTAFAVKADGGLVNLGVPAEKLSASNDQVVVFEGFTSQGWLTFKVYDFSTGSLTSLPVSAAKFRTSGERCILEVSELLQPQVDVNGDGDINDTVPFAYNGVTGSLASLGFTAWDVNGGDVSFDGSLVAQLASEQKQGGADLNGDGDGTDFLMAISDLASGTNQVVGPAILPPQVDGRLVAWLASEPWAGSDMNSDGDTLDQVLWIHDATSGSTWNTGLASQTAFADLQTFQLAGNRVLLKVSEAAQGQSDLNNDGDKLDLVMHAISVPALFGLTSSADQIRLTVGGEQRFSLDAGLDHAGEIYWLLGSLSGTSPGLSLGTFQLPLNPDTYTNLTLISAGVPPLFNTLGLLDPSGRAETPRLALPANTNPNLAGLIAHHAFVSLSNLGVLRFVSNPTRLNLIP